MIPASDPRFESVTKPDADRAEKWQGASYTSNWSERHVAFVCGLGTFGLSKGLITEKGIAGRLGSLIVSEKFAPRTREYTDIYEYCTRCGACIRRCPAGAISLENGKEHLPFHMIKADLAEYAASYVAQKEVAADSQKLKFHFHKKEELMAEVRFDIEQVRRI